METFGAAAERTCLPLHTMLSMLGMRRLLLVSFAHALPTAALVYSIVGGQKQTLLFFTMTGCCRVNHANLSVLSCRPSKPSYQL